MLKGSIVALITPFLENGEIDYFTLEKLLEFQIENHTKNLLVLGTTSESSTLSDDEKEKLLSFVVEKNKGRCQLVVGITSNNTNEAIIKAKKYQALGADYLLVITPYYNKCNDGGLIKHFSLIADCIDIPIILYNIPSRTGVNIQLDVIKKLKNHPKIIGIKEANRDISHLLDVSQFCDENFKLYCGNDDLLIIFLALNCSGSFNVYGNIDPALMNQFFDENNRTKLNDLFFEYYDIYKTIFIETNPIPIKALLNYQGIKVGGYRLPLFMMEDTNYQRMIELYQKVKNHSKII